MVFLPDGLEARLHRPHDWRGVQADRVRRSDGPWAGVPVALSGGRVGYYEADESEVGMGARPSNAYVWWIRGGVRYVVYEYAGSRANVIRMANSVVPVGGGLPRVFRPALSKLRRSGVTPILPTYLPPFRFYSGPRLVPKPNLKPVEEVSADPNGYLVTFSSRADVDKADMAYFQADRLRRSDGPAEGVPVSLSLTRAGFGAITAHYTPVDLVHGPPTVGLIWDTGGDGSHGRVVCARAFGRSRSATRSTVAPRIRMAPPFM